MADATIVVAAIGGGAGIIGVVATQLFMRSQAVVIDKADDRKKFTDTVVKQLETERVGRDTCEDELRETFRISYLRQFALDKIESECSIFLSGNIENPTIKALAERIKYIIKETQNKISNIEENEHATK